MEKVVWKDIDGFEGYYQVSNIGEIKSLSYYVNRYNTITNKDTSYTKKELILRTNLNKQGYLICVLTKNKITKTLIVHRIIAKTFIPNPNNLPEINHKDENKLNNSLSNLEWCDRKYNNDYSNITQRLNTAKKIKVAQYKGKTLLRVWNGIREAALNLNIDRRTIINSCKGRTTKTKYKWEYWTTK